MAFGQSRVRERWWGICHTVIFYAFLIFLIGTVELLVQSVVPGWQLQMLVSPDVAAVIYLIQTYFAWLTIVAMGIVSIRRILCKDQVHTTVEAWGILALILGIMGAHLAVMAAQFALGNAVSWLAYGLPFTAYMGDLISSSAQWVYEIGAAFHILCVAAFLVWIPRGKHLHIVFSFPSLFLQYRAYGPEGPVLGGKAPNLLQYESELESALEKDLPESDWPVMGAEKLSQLSQKQWLNAYACTQCQRCTNACSMVSAKLDQCVGPMQAMLKLRQLSAKKTMHDQKLVSNTDEGCDAGLMHVKELWSCTQCGACDRACPVGVEHTVRILDMRRAIVCREQQPQVLHGVFAAQERAGNPWGYPKSKRMDWAKEIEREASVCSGQKDKVKILLFAGCQGAYDPTVAPLLRRLVIWLRAHNYAVYTMKQEMCCGEPMLKLGNVAAFDAVKQHHLAEIAEICPDFILTICPHCAQTLKYDYADEETPLSVMHILEFMVMQWEEKRFVLPQIGNRHAVFHMPCGLGKLPDTHEVQRLVTFVRALGFQLPESDVTQAPCCGAGGGQFFLDHARPMAEQRAETLLATQPTSIVTACPFCVQMLSDAVSKKSETPPKTHHILEFLCDEQ